MKKTTKFLGCLTPKTSQSFFANRIQSRVFFFVFFLFEKELFNLKSWVEDWTNNEKEAF